MIIFSARLRRAGNRHIIEVPDHVVADASLEIGALLTVSIRSKRV